MSAKMDIYDHLWDNNKDIAEETLHVPFLEHMQMGDLQADYYVNFMIQDINYLLKVTDILEKMCLKVKCPADLQVFMKDRFISYKSYAADTLKKFNLKGVSDIIPTPAMEKYLSQYRAIMENEEPIYFAVALLPCARLWLWLARQLKESYGNAYFTWKKENSHGHPEDHYRALLNKYLTTPAQIERAKALFRQQMQHELDFFASSLEE
ncbi:uncharacterized protein LOC116224104 [Clupea harengus]|uniref:Uncharacterized protein LOC116224104 n=1 Tax=Clupea harengus TaxID=7950 RepID=A0A6P8GTA5_CLUHA|nr:uncharacterized protein LOC116224104 [Clupea harengus]XP_042566011.1 uncharacterized protein LOC116224104 [Clupea harengus]